MFNNHQMTKDIADNYCGNTKYDPSLLNAVIKYELIKLLSYDKTENRINYKNYRKSMYSIFDIFEEILVRTIDKDFYNNDFIKDHAFIFSEIRGDRFYLQNKQYKWVWLNGNYSPVYDLSALLNNQTSIENIIRLQNESLIKNTIDYLKNTYDVDDDSTKPHIVLTSEARFHSDSIDIEDHKCSLRIGFEIK